MYRVMMVLAATTLVLAVAPFLQTVAIVQTTAGPDLGWFGNGSGIGWLTPWALYAMGAAVVFSFFLIVFTLILAIGSERWLWMWSIGLLLPLGLFGWLAVVFGPLAGATLVFLPPVVIFAFGWQGWIQRRRTRLQQATTGA